jgi:hypothetical protein
MVCVRVPLLLKRNVRALFGVLRGPRSDVPFFFSLLWFCNYNLVYLWTDQNE